jgi:hypothetical protein
VFLNRRVRLLFPNLFFREAALLSLSLDLYEAGRGAGCDFPSYGFARPSFSLTTLRGELAPEYKLEDDRRSILA